MNTEDFNKTVWRASLAASFDLAGLSASFNHTKAAFLAASKHANAPMGQILPLSVDPTTIPDSASVTKPDGPDAHFNRQVLAVADTLPATGTPFYAPSGNRRAFGYQQYVTYADTGAPLSNAEYLVWQADKKVYDTELTNLNNLLVTGQTAFDSLKDHTGDFWDWVHTKYAGRYTLTAKEKEVAQIKARVDIEETQAFGPLGVSREQSLTSVALGLSHTPQEGGAYTMRCDKAWEPYYSVDSVAYNQVYTQWLRTVPDAKANPPYSSALELSQASSFDWSTYGLVEGEIEAGLTVVEPFFFFGEGSFATRDEKMAMYHKNSFSSISIKMTAMGTPTTLTVTPGDWYTSDPSTTFPKLLNAPANAADLLYPFVTQMVIAYGVGYEITLDQKTYQSFKSWSLQKKQGQVVGIFGVIFEATADGQTVNTRNFDAFDYSDETSTIRVMPVNTMIPNLVGVVVARSGHHIDEQSVSGDLAAALWRDSFDSVAYAKADSLTLAPLSLCFTSFYASLKPEQQQRFKRSVEQLFTSKSPDDAVTEFLKTLTELTGQLPPALTSDNSPFSDRMSFTQTFAASTISIVVESRNNNALASATPADEPAPFVLTPEAFLAMWRVEKLGQDVETARNSMHMANYVQSLYRLKTTLAPLLDDLASLASVRPDRSKFKALLKPSARLFGELASVYVPGDSMFHGQINPRGSSLPGRRFWRWETTIHVNLGPGVHVLSLYDIDDGRTPYDGLTAAVITIQGNKMNTTLSENSVTWFEGATTQAATVKIVLQQVLRGSPNAGQKPLYYQCRVF